MPQKQTAYSREYFANALSHPVLGRHLELHLARRATAGERTAHEALMTHNLRLVADCANHFWGVCQHLEFDDLFSAGCLGLDRAIRKFDPKKGRRLSTYAVTWINSFILDEIRKNELEITLSQQASRKAARLRRTRSKLEQQQGRPPTDDQLSAAAGLSAREFLEIEQAHHVTLLDTTAPASDATDERAQLHAIPTPAPDSEQIHDAALAAALAALPDGECRELIDLVVHEVPPARLAQELNTTHQQITQRQRRTLKLLRLRLAS